MSYLVSHAIDVAALLATVQTPGRGGVAAFVGTVRNHHGGRDVLRLDYSAYGPMAEAECARIEAEAESRWSVSVALQHRIGRLEIGDAAVAIAAASAHRDEAFLACRYVIEEVKRRAPIWKKEFYADGTVGWVEPSRGGEAGKTVSGEAAKRTGKTDQALTDRLARPLRSLRISVTDRCNMRCRYCMPEQDYVWLPRASILSFEEIDRLAGIFAGLGVDKIRLTGGEPLLRHDLPKLVALLRGRPQLHDIALTTNGILLAKHAAGLKAAGLSRVTVSVDTLKPERMLEFARSAQHSDVLKGIAAARAEGLGLKINAVVIRGYNDDELIDLVEFGRAQEAEVRFIEYMDVGGATDWSMGQVVGQKEILDTLARRYGSLEPVGQSGSAPAARFRLHDGTTIGIIASTTAPFCRTCDRARLTADGTFFLCLYGESGIDLREAVRSGTSNEEIAEMIKAAWTARTDRGAEVRALAPDRAALYQLETLRADPHREMHTRGG